MILTPRDGTSPTWVFPFNKPAPPKPGDNQALAVNTTDGSVLYDVAFALVWVTDGQQALNTNSAYAFAHCSGCTTVAVGFQVVLIVGQSHVVVPQNLSAAANYGCLNCLTAALADQLVVTLDRPLDAASMSRLSALWAQIMSFSKNLQGLALSDVQARLLAYEQQLKDIVKQDPGATPVQAGSGASTSTPVPQPASSAVPGGATGSGSGSTSAPAPADGATPAPRWARRSGPLPGQRQE